MRDRTGAANSNYRHGHATGGISRTYYVWAEMLQRCTNEKHPRWADYGGRGIAVCERWRVFENFLADMGEKPHGLSLDRWPDNDGGYEPDNCRWATLSEQAQNRRPQAPRPRDPDTGRFASL